MLFFLPLAIIAWVTLEQPTQVVDFNEIPAKIRIFNNSTNILSIQLKNFGVLVDGTGYNPYFYIVPNATNRNPIKGTCVWTTQTAAIFRVTFSTNGLPAENASWIYGCGLSNTTTGGKTTFNQGKLDIRTDPWR